MFLILTLIILVASMNIISGLIIFVGIPLPLTGVWTGSLASYLFGLSKSKSVFAIICGVLISSSIVTSLTIAGINIL